MNSHSINKIITVIVILIVIVSIILLFGNKSDTARLELVGFQEMRLLKNSQYIEPGYKILDVSSDAGFYVDVEGNVNTSLPGVYVIKYSLYNKNAQLISILERTVTVIEKNYSDISLSLNGKNEEYYFVNNYIDKGATAYQNNVDISNAIIVDSNVNKEVVGNYEVKYIVNTINGEYAEIKRIVHIINLNITKKIDEDNLKINLSIDSPNYSYTLLPNGTKKYEKNITYSYNDIGNYEFDVYLESGSHIKYDVKIVSIDNEGPKGTCTLYYDNNKTEMKLDITDKSGISKYVYNGMEFTDSSKTINSIITNAKIRAYDKRNNYSDIKCQAKYGTGFRNINTYADGTAQGKNGFIVCGTIDNSANQELDLLMKSYGYKTRDAVAAAGLYLLTYKYNIPYFWGGKSVKKGIDNQWGCTASHTKDKPCSKPHAADNSYCEYGLDCAGFTRWAFIQAGFDENILRDSAQERGMWGNFNANSYNYAFNYSNATYINQIKPGDIVYKPGHVGLVIGVGNDTIQIAEMLGPIYVNVINKYTGSSTNGKSDFTGFVLFDEFYKMYGN